MLLTNALTPTVMRRLSPAGIPAGILAALSALFLGFAAVSEIKAEPMPQQRASAGDAQKPAAAPSQLALFFKQHCIGCHGAEEQEAKVAVHTLAGQPRSRVELALWKRVVGQLESGHMPPDDAPQPSRQQRRQAIEALYEGLEKVGLRREGNEVDHDALFGKLPTDAPAVTEGRLWRLSQPAYENFLRDSFRGVKSASRVRAPWEMVPDPKSGFSDFASSHRIGEAELEHHLRNVLPIVREMTAGRLSPELAALTAAGESATAGQVEAGVAAVFSKVLSREPTEQERQRYAGFVQKNLREGEPKAVIEQLILAVLLHPEVFYRVEQARKEQQPVMTPHHLARAIAYTLTDQGPDAALLEAVEENRLGTPDEVHAQVLRILSEPETSKLRILRFFQEYFGYIRAPDVFKDAPTLQAAQVVEDAKYTRKESVWAEASYTFVRDADWLILDILEEDRDVLRQLLTTRETFTLTKPERGPRPVSASEVQKAKAKYRENSTTRGFFRSIPVELRVYELDELAIRRDAWAPDRRYEMPDGHRAGILTHPAWLVAHSDNFDNDPIHRGKWIREKLLGEKLPEIPITVDAQLPDEPHNILRERMRVTREEYCWKCHQRMDPLGLPFEMYDHFGRYRETEQGKPVDATGYLEGTGDPRLDGPVTDAVDLIQRLAASQRAEQVFVRHVFRYFVGRNETLEDGPALVQAHRAYAQNGGSMQALLASLLASPAFLQRAADSKYGEQ